MYGTVEDGPKCNRVERRQSRRPGDAATLWSRLVAVPGDRGCRRRLCGPRKRPHPAQGCCRARGARGRRRARTRGAYRHHQVFPTYTNSRSLYSNLRQRSDPRRTSGHRAAPEHPFGRALRRLARRVRSCPDRDGCTSQGLSRQPRHAIGFHGAHHLREEFFEGGGIEAITNDGFANLDDLVEAFKVSGARLVCLCSSNDIYASQATVTATELSKSPETYVYLAGRPAELEVMLKAAGMRSLICAGCMY